MGRREWHNGNSPHEGDWHDYATIRFNEYLTGRFGNQIVSQLLWTEKFLNLPDASIQIEKSTDGIIRKSEILDSANGTNLIAKGVNSSEVEISFNE